MNNLGICKISDCVEWADNPFMKNESQDAHGFGLEASRSLWASPLYYLIA
jgi:hypothetical protein